MDTLDKAKGFASHTGYGRHCRHSSQPRTKVGRPVVLRGWRDSTWTRCTTRKEEELETIQTPKPNCVSYVRMEPYHPSSTLEQRVEAEIVSKTLHNGLKCQ